MHKKSRLRRIAGRSGLPRNTTLRLSLIIHLLGPLKGKTPWWSRVSSLQYTHTAFELEGRMWDQAIDSVCLVYNADEWCREKVWTVPRRYAAFRVTTWVDWPHVVKAVESLEGRHGQRVRTLLRYLKLWPVPSWNCVSSVVIVLEAMGFETTSETPDELHRFLQLSVEIPTTVSGMGPSVEQIA